MIEMMGMCHVAFYGRVKNAFDTIDYGLSNCAYEIIKNYFMYRKHYVDFEYNKWGVLPISTGVPEGLI